MVVLLGGGRVVLGREDDISEHLLRTRPVLDTLETAVKRLLNISIVYCLIM